MSSGSTKRGKPSVPVRLELKQLRCSFFGHESHEPGTCRQLDSKPQAGSEKHEQNFNSREAALGAVNLLDASYERSSARFLRGGTRMVTLRHEGPDHGGRAVRLSARLATVRGFGQLGASLETVIRIKLIGQEPSKTEVVVMPFYVHEVHDVHAAFLLVHHSIERSWRTAQGGAGATRLC